MRTSNPVLGQNTFRGLARSAIDSSMTIQGTVSKSFLLLLMTVFTAGFVWNRAFDGQAIGGWMALGGIGGFIVALITAFKMDWARITAPIYALLEGLFLGGISALLESIFPGIVQQAVGLTFGVFLALLLVYKSRIIPVTQNFRMGVVAATGGVFLIYLATMLLGLFGIQIPYLHDSGPIGIIFSLAVVVIASLNLILDFDFIENGAKNRAPKYMEWYAAFGLMVTLIWLYISILRLLAILRGQD